MHRLETTPIMYLYRVLGLVQFSPPRSRKTILKNGPPVWLIPMNLYFIYVCLNFSTVFNSTTGIPKYVDIVSTFGSVLSMCTCTVMFYRRRTKIQSLLIEIGQTTLQTSVSHQTINWLKCILFCDIAVIIVSLPFFEQPFFAFFCFFLPMLVNIFDHLFLDDILTYLGAEFDMISQHLKQQRDSMALLDTQIVDDIERIQKLSLRHCDLSKLTLQFTRCFEVTTLAAMMMWFGYIVDSMFFFVFDLMIERHLEATIVEFATVLIYQKILILWLFITLKMYARTEEKVVRVDGVWKVEQY
jgi:hypothetical protein